MPLSFPDRERLRRLVRRRGTALVLALLVEALILLMLLTFTPKLPGKRDQGSLMTFGLEADQKQQKQEKKQEKKAAQQRQKAQEKPQPPQPNPSPTPEPQIELPPTIVKMNRQDFASSDVARFEHQAPSASSSASQGSADAGPDSAAVGKGRNGETLYAAEWYVRPTHTQLDTYISERARKQLPGRGVVECRTIENFHVDDCHILGEAPTGSGFGRAVLDAAWQFRVRPPRIGGKLMVGARVAIQIDYTLIRDAPGSLDDLP